MNEAEARSVLIAELAKYRERSYRQLADLIADPEYVEITAPSGAWYQLEFEAVWDDRPNEVLRVHATIDDSGAQAYFPMVECFLIKPNGEIVND